jgi:2,5-dioxopentanoate dehydrogenase
MNNINEIATNAWQGYEANKNLDLKQRAVLLNTIAQHIEALGQELVQTIQAETNLPEARILGEKARTVNQFRAFAADCENGNFLNIVIETAVNDSTPQKPDLRTMNIPIGPVLVFGASNFPLAYSTAGGDTASALAAGCSVIVKAHPAHILTSRIIALAINDAIAACGFNQNIFLHVEDDEHNTVATALVQHHLIKAVGFTGSPKVGKLIWNLANNRTQPIPVFAEMSSINPIFILPNKMEENFSTLATTIAASCLLGCGQFCTNPGLLIVLKSAATNKFIDELKIQFQNAATPKMLHQSIADNYRKTSEQVLNQSTVSLIAVTNNTAKADEVIPTLAVVEANAFINNADLQMEVFGSFSLIVICNSILEMEQVAASVEGQLTCTLMATLNDFEKNQKLIEIIQEKCGRINSNNVPTGVEVNEAMVHGGPWPATTDSRFTSVGLAAIKRFLRPLCFQNWENQTLPTALQNQNLWNINRKINGIVTKNNINS